MPEIEREELNDSSIRFFRNSMRLICSFIATTHSFIHLHVKNSKIELKTHWTGWFQLSAFGFRSADSLLLFYFYTNFLRFIIPIIRIQKGERVRELKLSGVVYTHTIFRLDVRRMAFCNVCCTAHVSHTKALLRTLPTTKDYFDWKGCCLQLHVERPKVII